MDVRNKRRKDENLEFLFGVGRALSQNRILFPFPFLHLDSALFFFADTLRNCRSKQLPGSRHTENQKYVGDFDVLTLVNTGLLKMIVGVLTNCHKQYT